MMFSPNQDDRLWKESPDKGWFRFPTPLKYIIFLSLAIICVIIIWYLFFSARQNYLTGEVAFIRADNSPFKVKAADQGVPSVKHQDKLVYGRIRNDQTSSPVEHILPDPEPPLVSAKRASPSLKMTEPYIPADTDPEAIAEIPAESSKDKATLIGSIEDLIEKEISPQAPLPQKKLSQGHILIQLGSLKSSDLAEAEWTRISNKNKDILGNYEPVIQKVDLGAEQGIYYRLRTGTFQNKDQAQKVCSSLKERKVDCLVIQQ